MNAPFRFDDNKPFDAWEPLDTSRPSQMIASDRVRLNRKSQRMNVKRAATFGGVKVSTLNPFFQYKRVGGLSFLKIGRLNVSWSFAKKSV